MDLEIFRNMNSITYSLATSKRTMEFFYVNDTLYKIQSLLGL